MRDESFRMLAERIAAECARILGADAVIEVIETSRDTYDDTFDPYGGWPVAAGSYRRFRVVERVPRRLFGLRWLAYCAKVPLVDFAFEEGFPYRWEGEFRDGSLVWPACVVRDARIGADAPGVAAIHDDFRRTFDGLKAIWPRDAETFVVQRVSA